MYFGVDYYPELYDIEIRNEKMAEDIELIKGMHMDTVRIMEFAWCEMEPQEGVFHMEHLTRVIEAMGEAGIQVILGTPTYAIPTWMVKAYPDILAVTNEGRGLYGHRQNMDITHPVYLFYAERAIRKMMV